MIALFLMFVLHRFASGIRNGAMYDEKYKIAKIFGFAIIPIIAAAIFWITTRFEGFTFLAPVVKTYSAWAFIGLSVVCTLFCPGYLVPRRPGMVNVFLTDLHLWTTLEQVTLFWGVLFSCGVFGIAPLLLAVYPAVFLQKAAINIFIGKNVFFNGTDDPSGKYYSIPALGIKIPRTGQVFRLVMAVSSIIVLFLLQYKK